jgi:hypothetical protein
MARDWLPRGLASACRAVAGRPAAGGRAAIPADTTGELLFMLAVSLNDFFLSFLRPPCRWASGSLANAKTYYISTIQQDESFTRFANHAAPPS